MLFYEKRLKTALSEIARRLKLKTFRFEYSGIDETFENYVGVMVPITLIEGNSDGEVCSRMLAKMPPNKKFLRDIGLLEYAYTAESFFYTGLLPCYKGFSRIDLSDTFAECYYSDTTPVEEVIILEDMRARGFRRHQENRFLDLDHAVVSLHSLALLHGLSMIYQNKTDNIATKHLNPCFLKFPPGLLSFTEECINNYLGIFRDTKHGAYCNKIAANFDNVVNDCVRNAKHLVYGHGDFWKENIMYKYEDNKPVKACALDFQAFRLLSPAQDILSFLLTSTQAELRRSYYDFFVETYYSRLRNILIDHSLDPNVIYSKNDLMCDLKTVSSYCFATANMSFSLWSGVKKDGMLKNKAEDNKPVKACALDFQAFRLLSPAQDVLSFLLTSTQAELRRSYYDFFVETYYSRLRNILIEHSLDPNVIYSKNDLMCDLKTVSSYCFATANMSFSLWSGVKKDGMLQNKTEISEESAAISFYKKTMLDIADDFITFGYYSP